MLSCHDVANYFLSLTDEDAGDLISNLKLQKLVHYAQGFHLALYDKPLFDEAIEAWTHGPVVPELYHAYKDFGANAIPRPNDVDFSIYDQQTRELLDEVYQVYGQFSAWKLRNMTHDEPPWRNAFNNGGIITQNSLKEFFKTQLIDSKDF
ncbi:Panacea domain-containing protein [Phormidesmis sp. 146-33]